MERPEIFTLPIDGYSADDAIQRIKDSTHPFWIVTANAEILLEAHKDKEFADAIRQADLRMLDGSGPAFMLRLFGERVHRVPGVDLAEKIIAWANEQNLRVGLIGGGEGRAEKAAIVLRRKFPKISIHSENGGRIEKNGNDDAPGEESRHRMTLFAPQVLLVAFGHPRQERWILNNLHDFPGLRAIMGVGGTFDFWAGTAMRAPKWMRSIGLEWLWRLIREPRRIKRIWRAVIIFPFTYVASLFQFPDNEKTHPL